MRDKEEKGRKRKRRGDGWIKCIDLAGWDCTVLLVLTCCIGK